MTKTRLGSLAIVLAVFTTGWTASLLAANDNKSKERGAYDT